MEIRTVFLTMCLHQLQNQNLRVWYFLVSLSKYFLFLYLDEQHWSHLSNICSTNRWLKSLLMHVLQCGNKSLHHITGLVFFSVRWKRIIPFYIQLNHLRMNLARKVLKGIKFVFLWQEVIHSIEYIPTCLFDKVLLQWISSDVSRSGLYIGLYLSFNRNWGLTGSKRKDIPVLGWQTLLIISISLGRLWRR